MLYLKPAGHTGIKTVQRVQATLNSGDAGRLDRAVDVRASIVAVVAVAVVIAVTVTVATVRSKKVIIMNILNAVIKLLTGYYILII